MIAIISRGTTFKIKLTIKDNGSNYNVWAHLFKPTDKMPIAGTCFKENTKPDEVIKWGLSILDKFNNDFLRN